MASKVQQGNCTDHQQARPQTMSQTLAPSMAFHHHILHRRVQQGNLTQHQQERLQTMGLTLTPLPMPSKVQRGNSMPHQQEISRALSLDLTPLATFRHQVLPSKDLGKKQVQYRQGRPQTTFHHQIMISRVPRGNVKYHRQGMPPTLLALFHPRNTPTKVRGDNQIRHQQETHPTEPLVCTRNQTTSEQGQTGFSGKLLLWKAQSMR